jgi:hypothetical protein
MTDNHFPFRDRLQKPCSHRDSGGEVRYLLRAEEQVLQWISAHAPLREVLHKICQALDSDIANMISVISLPNDETTSLAAIAKSRLFWGCTSFARHGLLAGMMNYLDSWRCTAAFRAAPFSPKLN